mmetsp:Transcript_3691/g.9373  ORF Transcript_3691/g.9373 Transcript_3691/m.9373 type:complete len:237 (+) Transcript_3691:91-801(+)
MSYLPAKPLQMRYRSFPPSTKSPSILWGFIRKFIADSIHLVKDPPSVPVANVPGFIIVTKKYIIPKPRLFFHIFWHIKGLSFSFICSICPRCATSFHNYFVDSSIFLLYLAPLILCGFDARARVFLFRFTSTLLLFRFGPHALLSIVLLGSIVKIFLLPYVDDNRLAFVLLILRLAIDSNNWTKFICIVQKLLCRLQLALSGSHRPLGSVQHASCGSLLRLRCGEALCCRLANFAV